MKKRKKALSLLLASVFIASMAACAAPAGSSAPPPASAAPTTSAADSTGGSPAPLKATIRFGRVNTGVGPTDAAYLDGAYKAAGLTIEKQSFSAGTDAVAALVGGSLDVVLGSYEHVLRQVSNGLDITCVAELSSSAGYQLLTQNDSPYQKLEDLKGKIVGVSKVGSLSDSVLRQSLKNVNLDPAKDVKIINAGTGATVMSVFESGQVAAAMINDPTRSMMVATGKYRVMYDPDNETAGLILMCSKKWAQENSEALKAFLKVTKDEAQKIKADPQSFVKVFKPEFPDTADDVLLLTIKNLSDTTPADLVLTKAAADDVLKTQMSQGTITKEIPMEQASDMSYLS